MAKTLLAPLLLITDVLLLLLLQSLLIFAVFFYNATVSLGFSDQDEDIQGGMKRKRKKSSDQDKAGELN